MPYVYKMKTNLSFMDFEVIADSEGDAFHTADVILNQLIVREAEQGVEVV